MKRSVFAIIPLFCVIASNFALAAQQQQFSEPRERLFAPEETIPDDDDETCWVAPEWRDDYEDCWVAPEWRD
jgi:hypothetical protein